MYFDSYCRVVLEQRSEVPRCIALLLSEWGPIVHGRHALLRALRGANNPSTPLFEGSVEMAAPAAGAAPAPVPAPARSLFRLVGGGPGTTRWDLIHDSPIISALPFVGWVLNAAGTHSEAPRSELVGALLTQADRPA